MALTFTELGNASVAKQLLNLSFKTYTSKFCSDKATKKARTELNLIKQTCKQIVDGNGAVQRTFAWSKGKPFGRRYTVNYGIQGLRKNVRGMLSENLTTDVDIVMCCQMILLKICQDHSIKCDHLKYYIQNRESVLESLYTSDGFNRDQAKIEFHKCINSANVCSKKISNSFFKSFDSEMKRIMSILWDIEDYNWMKQYASTDKGNVKGSFMSNLLFKLEDEIITACIPALKKINVEICTLCFDGFLVKGNVSSESEKALLLDTLTEVTTALGYTSMKWAIKKHNTEVVDLNVNVNESLNDSDTLTEADYADTFVEDNQGKLLVGAESAYIINEFGIYTLVKNAKQEIRYRLIQDYPNVIYLRTDSHLNAVTNIIYTLMQQQDIEDRFDKCHNLIPFTNGVYDLKSGEFRPAHIHEYVTSTLDYAYQYIELTDFSDIETLLRGLFKPDAQEYALWKIGNILKGHNKTFTVLHGEGNNGKTKVFVELIRRALGNFFKSVSPSLVTANKFDDSPEKPQPEKLGLMSSMFNVVNELKQGTIMCSSKIKEYTGGNQMEARKLHSNTQVKFHCRGQIFIDTNTLGTFDEVDQPLRDRLEVIPFPYRFIAPDHPERDPENVSQKDLIENVLDNYECIPVKMINLMIYYFQQPKPNVPVSVSSAKRSLIASIDDVEQFLMQCTRGKGNSEGKEMHREYRESGGELKTSQFKRRMKSKGYEYKKVSVCGQKVYGYMGISCGADDEFDDPE